MDNAAIAQELGRIHIELRRLRLIQEYSFLDSLPKTTTIILRIEKILDEILQGG